MCRERMSSETKQLLASIDQELEGKRARDARASVDALVERWPAEANEAARRRAERVLEVAIETGVAYSGNVARLAQLVYAPPRLGSKELDAARPRGLVR